jgi:serine/threonine protein kinase
MSADDSRHNSHDYPQNIAPISQYFSDVPNRERFFREAEAAGRLSHPGIATIFDMGEEPETRTPYIVMEFVGGQSLDKLLARNDNKLLVEKALQLTIELAEALDCAHGQGVVHRDLKPANILIMEYGRAKIAQIWPERAGVPQNVPYAPSRYAPIRAFSLLRQRASVRAWLWVSD